MVEKSEQKRNRLLLLICCIAYTISYIGKYSYSTNIQNVITELQITKAQAGYVTSAFFFCYGIGQVLNGILCEKMNSTWTVTISLATSAILTFLMFFFKNVVVLAVLWGLNGVVLSVLWSHCIKLLATIRDKKYMAKCVTCMSLTLPAGVVSAYGSSALFTYLNFWKLSYLFSAVLLMVIAIVFFFVVGKIEKANRSIQQEQNTQQDELSTVDTKQQGGSLFKAFGFLAVPLLIISVCAGLIRDGASTWMPTLLTDIYSMPDYFSILLTVGLPLMGVFTALLSTNLIKWTKNVFGSCLVAGIVGSIVTVVLVFTFQNSFVLLIAIFMLLSVVGYVLANTITSVMPLFYKGKLKSGQTAGITNACVYLGSTLSSFCLGSLVDNLGWQSFMICMCICSVVTLGLSLLGIVFSKKKLETNI